MVGVAQLVEHWIVAPEVVGSRPIVHPIFSPVGRSTVTLASRAATGLSAQQAFVPDFQAKVAELVDALDLGSSGATRESSSLSFRTRHHENIGSGGCHALEATCKSL